jgi:hypothetical protein
LDAINTFILPSTLQGIRAQYVVKLAARPSDQSEWIDRWDEVRSSSFVLKSRVLSAASITLKSGKDTGILELVDPIASSDVQQVIDVKVILKVGAGRILNSIMRAIEQVSKLYVAITCNITYSFDYFR